MMEVRGFYDREALYVCSSDQPLTDGTEVILEK